MLVGRIGYASSHERRDQAAACPVDRGAPRLGRARHHPRLPGLSAGANRDAVEGVDRLRAQPLPAVVGGPGRPGVGARDPESHPRPRVARLGVQHRLHLHVLADRHRHAARPAHRRPSDLRPLPQRHVPVRRGRARGVRHLSGGPSAHARRLRRHRPSVLGVGRDRPSDAIHQRLCGDAELPRRVAGARRRRLDARAAVATLAAAAAGSRSGDAVRGDGDGEPLPDRRRGRRHAGAGGVGGGRPVVGDRLEHCPPSAGRAGRARGVERCGQRRERSRRTGVPPRRRGIESVDGRPYASRRPRGAGPISPRRGRSPATTTDRARSCDLQR